MNLTIAKRDVTKEILRNFKIRASKKLGQNFLINENVVKKIIYMANIKKNDLVLEIGPGIGSLTEGLLNAGAIVKAIELDKKMVEVLDKVLLQKSNLQIIQNDILSMNLKNLFGGKSYKIVANLPYYITTPIIMTLIEQEPPLKFILSMVQKETAERFIANPSSKEYGAVSVAVNYIFIPSILFEVSASSFIPEPKVSSCMMRFDLRQCPPVKVIDKKFFFYLIKAAFAERRKTLKNNLINIGITKDEVQSFYMTTGIDCNRRGETLSVNEFVIMTNFLYNSM